MSVPIPANAFMPYYTGGDGNTLSELSLGGQRGNVVVPSGLSSNANLVDDYEIVGATGFNPDYGTRFFVQYVYGLIADPGDNVFRRLKIYPQSSNPVTFPTLFIDNFAGGKHRLVYSPFSDYYAACVPNHGTIWLRRIAGTGSDFFNASSNTVTCDLERQRHSIFGTVSPYDHYHGITQYRCFLYGPGGSNGYYSAKDVGVFLRSRKENPLVTYEIGVDPAGIGDGTTTGVPTTISVDTEAPSGVSFSKPSIKNPLFLQSGAWSQGTFVPIWIKRTIKPSVVTTELNLYDSCYDVVFYGGEA